MAKLVQATENRLVVDDLPERAFVGAVRDALPIPQAQKPEVHEALIQQSVQPELRDAVEQW